MSGNRSLTLTYPWPDRRSRPRRLIDWLRRRPYKAAGTTTVYIPNAEVQSFFVVPDGIGINATAHPVALGKEWVSIGYMDGDAGLSDDPA